MTIFKVETRNPKSGVWSVQVTIKPEYEMGVETFWKFWPFLRGEIGVIPNLREAEEHALEKALRHARIFYAGQQTRVMRETEAEGKKQIEAVWQNGFEVNHDPPGLLQRLWDWLTGPVFSGAEEGH